VTRVPLEELAVHLAVDGVVIHEQHAGPGV
jgi:hypothetical protein